MATCWVQIEFVGGAVFSCAWAAGISNCTRIAPKGMQATVQAIYQVWLAVQSRASLTLRDLSSALEPRGAEQVADCGVT